MRVLAAVGAPISHGARCVGREKPAATERASEREREKGVAGVAPVGFPHSPPITSTPSYPASSARAAQRAKSSIVRSTCDPDSAFGVNHPMGAFLDDGATLNGW